LAQGRGVEKVTIILVARQMIAGMVRPILRGITLSGRAERAGYDLASVRRGTLITEGTELAEEAAMLVFLKECEKVFDGCNFGIRLVASLLA
jgi:hypothetical protein